MDSRQTYSEVNGKSTEGFLYTFDSDFVLELMRHDLFTSVPIVVQIERYVDINYTESPYDVLELAGVIKKENPFFFVVVLSHYDEMIFENFYKINSDNYLDYYNKNMLLSIK